MGYQRRVHGRTIRNSSIMKTAALAPLLLMFVLSVLHQETAAECNGCGCNIFCCNCDSACGQDSCGPPGCCVDGMSPEESVDNCCSEKIVGNITYTLLPGLPDIETQPPVMTNTTGIVQHRILKCESSTVQRDYECQHAFDGDTSKYHPQETSFILGWAYGGNVPAFGTFYLEGLVSINTIIIKTGLNRQDHHLTHFAIGVQVGNEFKPVVITKVNVAKSKINENKVETNGEMNIRVAFETMSKVSAIKVHAFGSDASNENSVVNEIYALFLSDKYLHWVENDVDEILDEVHGDA